MQFRLRSMGGLGRRGGRVGIGPMLDSGDRRFGHNGIGDAGPSYPPDRLGPSGGYLSWHGG